MKKKSRDLVATALYVSAGVIGYNDSYKPIDP